MNTRGGWRCVLVAVVLAVAAAAAPTPAAGQWLDQQPNHLNGGFSDLTCGVCGNISYEVAESFTLEQVAALEEIVIWGGHLANVSFADSFSISVYPDAGGLPGSTPVYTEAGVVPVSAVPTGAVFGGTTEVEYTLRPANPPDLAAGTWWVELANDSTGYSEDFIWEHGVTDSVHGAPGSMYSIDGGSWNANGSDYSIQLPAGNLFADGFESGDTTAWSSSAP